MEGPVSGIRRTFLRDLTEDYLKRQTSSFLYRTFWSENMSRLLKKHFPELLVSEQSSLDPAGDVVRLRRQMAEVMRARPDWADRLPLRDLPWKLRRDLWEELWLNDAGYRAGLIADTEYYLWLAQYLSLHDVYKTNIYYYDDKSLERDKPRHIHSGLPWLYVLLAAGLDMGLSELQQKAEARRRARKKPRQRIEDAPAGAGLSKLDGEEALAMLAEQIQSDRDKVAGRLHDLRYPNKKQDYLLWLTDHLEWMALHIKIKNWLQDSGYPLVGHDETKEPPKEEKKLRRNDFTMRLFEAWCDSEEGYELRRKPEPGAEDGEDAGEQHIDENVPGSGEWRIDENVPGICVLNTDQEQLDALIRLHEAEQDGPPYLYIPLAVHLYSGCVFFLAGKEYYESVYEEAGGKLMAQYQKAEHLYCFDYFRRREPSPGSLSRGGEFYLAPTFHENRQLDYQSALKEFDRYCILGTSLELEQDGRETQDVSLQNPASRPRPKNGPLHAVQKYNGLEPEHIPDDGQEPEYIPETFRWAFES